MDIIFELIRLSRPIYLIWGVLLYSLGVSVARYLGVDIDWTIYIIGQFWVSLLQLIMIYLNVFYYVPAGEFSDNKTPLSGIDRIPGSEKLNRRMVLLAAFTCLAVFTSFTVILISQHALSLTAIFLMGFSFVGSLFYSMPPFRLEVSGYGELLLSVIIAFMVPTFSFVLQMGEIHRFVVMAVFPITLMYLAMLLALELPDYFTDLKHNKRTVMVRMGWHTGMILHNILILCSYLVLGFAAFTGLPTFAWLPTFFTFPLGVFQIWQMRQISLGIKPNWRVLTIGAFSLFGLMAYLMTYAFWTH